MVKIFPDNDDVGVAVVVVATAAAVTTGKRWGKMEGNRRSLGRLLQDESVTTI
jgi:hypothetical protein